MDDRIQLINSSIIQQYIYKYHMNINLQVNINLNTPSSLSMIYFMTTFSTMLKNNVGNILICLHTHLKPIPFRAVPMRVQGFPAHISLMCHATELYLHKSIRSIASAVHYRQVPTRQYFNLYFSGHFRIYLTP